MNPIETLKARIQEKLTAAEESRRQQQQKATRFSMNMQENHQRFKEIALPLMTEIVYPRMEELKGFFENADWKAEPGRSRLYQMLVFEHSERFPATTKLELSASADRDATALTLSCDLEILPVLFQFDRHKEMAMAIDEVDEDRVIEWVDERLCQFVDTYLHLEKPGPYSDDSLVLDPVCKMRIVKTFAAAEVEHSGKTYYFCIPECERKFLDDPETYLNQAQE